MVVKLLYSSDDSDCIWGNNYSKSTVYDCSHPTALMDFGRCPGKYILPWISQTKWGKTATQFHVPGPTSSDTETAFPGGTHRQNTCRAHVGIHTGLWLISWIGHASNLKDICLLGPQAASHTCQLVHFLLTRTCTCCSCWQQWACGALTPGPIPMAGNWSHSLFSWHVGQSTCPYGGTQSLLVLWTHRCLCPRNLQFLVLKFSHSSLLSCWHYRCSCWHYRPPTYGLHNYCTQSLQYTYAHRKRTRKKVNKKFDQIKLSSTGCG